MKIKIELTHPFSDAAGCREIVLNFNGNTVEQLLSELVMEYPALEKHIFDNGELTDFLILVLNNKLLTDEALNEVITNDGDCLGLLLPISGG